MLFCLIIGRYGQRQKKEYLIGTILSGFSGASIPISLSIKKYNKPYNHGK